MAILRVFAVASAVTVLLSILLASTIAGPVRRLASGGGSGAPRRQASARRDPDLGSRKDEIRAPRAAWLAEMTKTRSTTHGGESRALPGRRLARAEDPAEVAQERGGDAADSAKTDEQRAAF